MFPLSDSVKSKSFPFVTVGLIIINVVVFIFQLISPDAFTLQYALTPSHVNFSNFITLIPFFTAMFLHGGFFHIISNMWFLGIFGDDVEDHLGKFRFLIFYLAAGIIANVAQFLLQTHSPIPVLGASGAISGVLGAYYILFPRSKIKTFLVVIIFVTIVDIPAVIYLFYWFFLQIFSGVASLSAVSNSGGVAFWAHVAGFVTGLLYANRFKNKEEKNYIEGEIVE